jgi:hypothetical protein
VIPLTQGIPVAERDQVLLERAATWNPSLDLGQFSAARLKAIADADGIEFATALLHDRIRRVPENRDFGQQVESMEHQPLRTPSLVGIVPGAFYGEHKTTGADGKRIMQIAEELGCQSELIPVRSFGSLSQNAQIILDWLKRRPSQRLALVSLSKGGADAKIALSKPEARAAFQNVTAWISFSGIVQGTPLVAWLRRRPLRWLGVWLLLRLRGHRPSVLDGLRHEHDAPLATWPPLPAHLRVIHILGFPLCHHLAHPWAHRAYERLAPLGPTDGGGIVLADAIGLPGVVFPVWGADHYLEPEWNALPLLRNVLRAAINL